MTFGRYTGIIIKLLKSAIPNTAFTKSALVRICHLIDVSFLNHNSRVSFPQ